MADGVFNVGKGHVAEMFRASPNSGILLMLSAAEADSALQDRTDLSDLLGAAGNTEATNTGYSRKTGIAVTVTIDQSNDRVDVDMADQTFSSVASGGTWDKAVFAHERTASEAGRIPCTHQDTTITPDGSDITIELNASGFFRAS